MLENKYAEKIIELLNIAKEKQLDNISLVAKKIAKTIKNDGVFHLFGCGHSHILVEEVFYRAGGIVPVNPIFETSTMLHEGAIKSSKIERMQGYAEHILDNYSTKEGEVIVIISNSGINSLPIEMAMAAKKKGLTVVALTSSSYANEESRHPSEKKLADLADYIIDNMMPYGDALVKVQGVNIKMSPGSTVMGAFLMNMLIARVVEELIEMKVEPPIFLSGNIAGGMEYNQRYIEKYQHRIKHL